MWVIVMPGPYLFHLHILVTVLSFEQAHLLFEDMCVSHHHLGINVTRALSISFENFSRIFAELGLWKITEHLVCVP